ncbi:MAG: hypothetical protein ACPGU5_00350 [Lishizhenia sp.]
MRLKQLLIVFVLSVTAITVLTKVNNTQGGVIYGDGRGYYAYLPSFFIYGNLSFKESAKAEFKSATNNPSYLHKNQHGSVFNKYYPGVAIMQIPFFWLAQVHCVVLNIADDGYNWVHDFWIRVGYFFYTLLGSFLLYLVLGYFSAAKWTRITTVVLLGAGSVLLYNAFKTPSFSHGISFFLICLFCLQFLKTLRAPRAINFILIGLILGLIVLVRPINILVLFALPIFLETRQRIKLFFSICKEKWRYLILSIIFFLIVISVLFLINFIQTGFLLNWSYKGEGFNFFKPHVLQLWFSFRIGFFTHLPFFFLFITGLFFLKNKRLLFSILLYFLILSYVFSCWWCWDYGGSFGNRVFVDHYFVFTIPILFVIEKIWRNKLWMFVPISLCIFNGIRLYQIHNQIIMNRFTPSNYFKSLGLINKKYKRAFVFTEEFGLFNKAKNTRVLLDKKEEVDFGANKLFGLEANYKLNDSAEDFYLEVDLEKKRSNYGDYRDVFLVVDGRNEKGETEVYKSYPLYNYCFEGEKEFVALRIKQILMYEMSSVKSLKIYIWNKSKQNFIVKNAKIKLTPYMY